MFDDGIDLGSSRKEEEVVGGTKTGLSIVTTRDREEREEGSERGSGSRPASASHRHSPGSPGGRNVSERERGGNGKEVKGSGGKSLSKGKSGSPSKGKGKTPKGGPAARHERSPRSRARSFSNLPYPEPAVPGRWVPSKLLGRSPSGHHHPYQSHPIPYHSYHLLPHYLLAT